MIVALDFDGTLVEERWPAIGADRPGAVEGVRALLDEGHTVYLFTARTNATWRDGAELPPAAVFEQRQAVRDWLDSRGLHAVGIAPNEKPHFDVLVDDKVLFCPPSRRAWRHLPIKIVTRAARR